MCSLTDDLDFENEVPSDFKQTSKYQKGVDRNKRVQGTTDAVSVKLFKFGFRTFFSGFYLFAIQRLLQLVYGIVSLHNSYKLLKGTDTSVWIFFLEHFTCIPQDKGKAQFMKLYST